MALILHFHGVSTREVVIVLPDAQGRTGTVVVVAEIDGPAVVRRHC